MKWKCYECVHRTLHIYLTRVLLLLAAADDHDGKIY